MPAIAAHYYYGQDIYKRLPEDIKAIVNVNKQAFDIGLQGADIFFYYQPLRRHVVNIYGHVLHSKSAKDFFEHAVEYLKGSEDLSAFSYLIGYACHFALDSECHGVINQLAPSVTEHLMLETELDRLALLDRVKLPPEEVRRYEYINATDETVVAMTNVFEGRTFEEIRDSLESMRFYSKIIHSPKGIKQGLLSKLERFVSKSGNFTCLSMTKKPYVQSVELAKKIYTMWDEALEVGLNLIDNLYETIVFEDRLSPRFDRAFE